MKLCPFYLTTILFLTLSCGRDIASRLQGEHLGEEDLTPTLGAAFDSAKDRLIASPCIKLKPKAGEHGLPIGTVEFRNSLEQEQIKNALGIAASGRGSFGVVGIQAGASFAREFSESSLSQSYVYRFSGRERKLGDLFDFEFGPAALNVLRVATKEEAIEKFRNQQVDRQRWMETCGDRFVAEIEQGAELLAALKLTFASQQEKQSVTAQLGIQTPFYDLQASLSSGNLRLAKRATVNMKVIQIGGRPVEMGQMFGEKLDVDVEEFNLDHPVADASVGSEAITRESEAEKPAETNTDGSKKEPERRKPRKENSTATTKTTINTDPKLVKQNLYAITACSIENIGACTRAMSDVIGYFNGSFAEQVKGEGGAAVFAYHTLPYSALGLSFRPDVIGQNFKNERAKLESLVDAALGTNAAIHDLRNARSSEAIKDLADRMTQWRMKVLREAVPACYEFPSTQESDVSECIRLVAEATTDLESIKESLSKMANEALVFAPSSFEDWCFLGANPLLSKELRDSIQVTRAAIAIKLGMKALDSCADLQAALTASINQFDSLAIYPGMSGEARLHDARPLASLKMLRTLIIKGQGLRKIESLARITNLEYLNISDNDVFDIGALKDLKSLRTLVAHGNRSRNKTIWENYRTYLSNQLMTGEASIADARLPRLGLIDSDQAACDRHLAFYQESRDISQAAIDDMRASNLFFIPSIPGDWTVKAREKALCSTAARYL